MATQNTHTTAHTRDERTKYRTGCAQALSGRKEKRRPQTLFDFLPGQNPSIWFLYRKMGLQPSLPQLFKTTLNVC